MQEGQIVVFSGMLSVDIITLLPYYDSHLVQCMPRKLQIRRDSIYIERYFILRQVKQEPMFA